MAFQATANPVWISFRILLTLTLNVNHPTIKSMPTLTRIKNYVLGIRGLIPHKFGIKNKNTKYILRTTYYRKSAGFTLIELLVVISIIGILSTLGVVSYSAAQVRTRDAKRKSDFDTIKKALEIYKGDTPSASYYPSCPASGGCNPNGTTPPLAPTYIAQVPSDPRDPSFVYAYVPSGCSGINCTGYYLQTCLENANEIVGGNVVADTTLCPASGKALHVINP